MNKVRVLNSKLSIDICNRVCEYDKCDKCRKKILEVEDFDENPKLSKLNKVQKIITHTGYFATTTLIHMWKGKNTRTSSEGQTTH